VLGELQYHFTGCLLSTRGKKRNTDIVDEPDQTDDKKAPAIELEDEKVGGFGILHRVPLKFFRLLKKEAEHQQKRGEDDTDAEAGSPDGAILCVVACSSDDVGNKRANNKALGLQRQPILFIFFWPVGGMGDPLDNIKLTQSIMLLVKRMNHMFLLPDLSSPVDSAHPTLPAGYSPPMPMPTCARTSYQRSALFYIETLDWAAYKEAPGCQDVEHADRVAMIVGTRRQSRKDDEDDGG